ncbi:MAG TPA: chemotaxis response regulator protein-glutamate methylesterase [Firmicutes bacterium]|nr:chemotaxis response regulator protein-glutamate methylesterase [Bacillota bacterium]
MIRVLIVDDSLVVRKMLSHILEQDPEIKVIDFAHDGLEGIEKIRQLKPDLVTMDVCMPVLDGIKAVEEIMASTPVPILIITSSSFLSEGKHLIYRALEAGALDVVKKPDIREWDNPGEEVGELIRKVKLLSKVKVIRHVKGARYQDNGEGVTPPKDLESMKVIVIVSSTGGPKSLVKVLSQIPPDFPSPILIVQHIADGFIGGLSDWLNNECKLPVKVAEQNEKIKPAHIYLAPTGRHMKLNAHGRIQLTDEPPINGLKPAGDYLLESAAESFRKNLIAVIMTGMGNDGSRGVLKVKNFGGEVIAQNEETCVVFGMPKAAIDTGSVDKVVSLEHIAKVIIKTMQRSG